MKEFSPFHEPARLFVRWGVLDNRSLSWCRYFVWGAAWFRGILGEMVPLYFVGWSVDPESISVARLDLVNLSAAFYGLLWIPLGYAVWDY